MSKSTPLQRARHGRKPFKAHVFASFDIPGHAAGRFENEDMLRKLNRAERATISCPEPVDVPALARSAVRIQAEARRANYSWIPPPTLQD